MSKEASTPSCRAMDCNDGEGLKTDDSYVPELSSYKDSCIDGMVDETGVGLRDEDDDEGLVLKDVVVTDESVVELEEMTDDVGATVVSDSLPETGIGSLSTVLGGRDAGESRVDGIIRGLDSGRLGIVPMFDGGLLLLGAGLIRSLRPSPISRKTNELVVGELTVKVLLDGGLGLGTLELGRVSLSDLVLVGHNSAV